jgi:hypothetical protein
MLYLGKLLLKAVWVMILTFVGTAGVLAQTMHNQYPDTVFINSSQQLALKILAGTDTLSRSLYWPNIDPALFFDNVRMNVLYPDKINQGQSNNLCGYATVTYILLKYQPEVYVQSIIELYQKGELHLNKKKFRASKNVRNAAGTLKYNGDLQILHANQLWLLFLADNFKGYINILNYKYQRGDEKNLWASTTYAKFNRMLKRVDNYPTEALGSDLIRPWRNKFKYLSREIHSGTIILYVNSNYIRPSKYTLFKWPMPTHYVVLNEISRTDGVIQIKYWDYGLKTEQFVTKKGLRKMIYGITKIRN